MHKYVKYIVLFLKRNILILMHKDYIVPIVVESHYRNLALVKKINFERKKILESQKARFGLSVQPFLT